MPLVTLRQILDHAAENAYAVAAVNVNNMEQVQALMAAAQETDSAAILAVSRGSRHYAQLVFLHHVIKAALELHPQIPVCVHLDHGNRPDICVRAIESGFTSVMIDGSLREDGKTPATYEYNVAITRRVVELARLKGVSVEGELSVLGLIRQDLCDDGPIDACGSSVEFVRETGVDVLELPRVFDRQSAFNFRPGSDVTSLSERYRKLCAQLPNCHLSIRGLWSPPQQLVEVINRYGGHVRCDIGVSDEGIQQIIRAGIRKIAVDIPNRLAFTGAVRKVLAEHPGVFDPREYLHEGREAMKRTCIDRMIAFGQAGHGSKLTERLRART